MSQSRNNKPHAKDKPVLACEGDESFNGRAVHIQVYVDWVAIIRTLGAKAVRNKNDRASLMYGTIVVKAS